MNNTEIYNLLSEFITPSRLQVIEQKSLLRTKYLTVALENIHHPQNISAVLRSCDCFGLQDVHIIENRFDYKINPKIVRGSDQWLDIYQYNEKENNTKQSIKSLKDKGYRIVATTPHENDTDLDDFDLSKGPSVIFFGTEKEGISKTVIDEADEFIKIPMHGFTESLNISVAAGIIIHHLSLKLRNSDINWQLSSDELNELKLKWIRLSVKRPDLIEQRFLT